MADLDLPPGYGIPLADLTTGLLPDRTMDAFDNRYAVPVRLTQAEYDALPPEEQNNPHYIYMIPE